MKHKPQFPLTDPDAIIKRQKEIERQAEETAAAYSRVFSTPDGKRVLADLKAKFDPERSRFDGHSDLVRAAKIDGQGEVVKEIKGAIKRGAPITGLQPEI